MSELYFSVDIETDGPIPGPNSMLSLGAVAFDEDGKSLDEFEVNFELLEGAAGHPETMAWWAKQEEEIWKACRANPRPPAEAMSRFSAWVQGLSEKHKASPVCVAYPAGFDFLFVYWYLIRFCGESPFSFSCLDMKTYAAATLKLPYRQATKKHMPRGWFSNLPPHTHRALDDAREQGLLFFNMRRQNLNVRP